MDLGQAFALGMGLGSVMGWVVAFVQERGSRKVLEKQLVEALTAQFESQRKLKSLTEKVKAKGLKRKSE